MRTFKHQISKAVLVNDLISDYHIEFFHLTEPWLDPEEYVSLNEAAPPGHINTHIPPGAGRGGGVAIIFDSTLLISPKSKLNYNLFENPFLSFTFKMKIITANNIHCCVPSSRF